MGGSLGRTDREGRSGYLQDGLTLRNGSPACRGMRTVRFAWGHPNVPADGWPGTDVNWQMDEETNYSFLADPFFCF